MESYFQPEVKQSEHVLLLYHPNLTHQQILTAIMTPNGCDDTNIIQGYEISELSRKRLPVHTIMFITLWTISNSSEEGQDERNDRQNLTYDTQPNNASS